jgi:diaminopimelate decarboxylase
MELQNGTYTVQGIALEKMASQFGTPLYVYNASKIVSQINVLKEAFTGVDLKIKFAAKALTNINILKVMKQQGIGVDVVSVNEGRLALAAGFTSSEIMFTPSGVEFSEIEEALGLGFSLNIDSLPALEKFGAAYSGSKPCALRINPGVMAGGNYKISTGHIHSKFGISIQQLPQIVEVVKKHNIQVAGLHVHTGSEVVDVGVFLQVANILFEAGLSFATLQFIDFGGGFKVAYKKGDKVTDMPSLGKALTEAFRNFCTRYGRELQLWIEPGKFLVSESGYLLTKATVVKETPALTFVGVNTGLNHLIRPMMYDAHHEIVNLSNPTGPEKQYNIVGYICETDTLAAERLVNEVREGDVLAILNAGAYGFSMASNYNARTRPAEVLIENGEARVIRKAETFDDLLKGQVVQ